MVEEQEVEDNDELEHNEQSTIGKKKKEKEKSEQVCLCGIIEGKDLVSQLVVLGSPIPTIKKKLLRSNIFCSTGSANGHECMMVIDGGSSDNIVLQTLVDCLMLRVYKHHHSYFVR